MSSWWIYDPTYWWSVPTEYWQQDDAIVKESIQYQHQQSDNAGLFKSQLSGNTIFKPTSRLTRNRGTSRSVGFTLPWAITED